MNNERARKGSQLHGTERRADEKGEKNQKSGGGKKGKGGGEGKAADAYFSPRGRAAAPSARRWAAINSRGDKVDGWMDSMECGRRVD